MTASHVWIHYFDFFLLEFNLESFAREHGISENIQVCLLTGVKLDYKFFMVYG